MSQSREDYLKFIYEKGQGQTVSNKEIAQGLGIAPPSVSEMINKLAVSGLVRYIPYHGVVLTTEGHQMAKDVLRKHQIWECFLEKYLNYSEEEVHELAELLEHTTPNHLADRLANFINYDQE